MASAQLSNYLRANRKRLDLTQDELAFLLGVEGAPKVCRYETFAREPSLRTLLAFEAVFQKTPSELFAGLYRTSENIESKNQCRQTATASSTDVSGLGSN